MPRCVCRRVDRECQARPRSRRLSSGRCGSGSSSLDYIVPTGTAIQNGRQTSLGDTFLNPSDELHLNTTYGAFTASCTWFETFTGVDVTTNPFCPAGVDAATAALCRKAAHQAVLHPTAVTKVE